LLLGQEELEAIMSESNWLDIYSGQSTDELISLEGKYRTDSLVLVFEQALDQKAYRLGQDGLTLEENVVLAVEALEREVNNGGYDQFLVNPSKEYAPIVVDALKRIGCDNAAQLTQQAIDILAIDGPVTIEAIDRVMEEQDEERDQKLGACDVRYFKEAGDLSGSMLEFIKRNKDKITLKE